MGNATPTLTINLADYLPTTLHAPYFSSTGLADQKTRQIIRDCWQPDYAVLDAISHMSAANVTKWQTAVLDGAQRLLAEIIHIRSWWSRIETCGINGTILHMRVSKPRSSPHLRQCRLCKQYLPMSSFTKFTTGYSARCDDCKGKQIEKPIDEKPKTPQEINKWKQQQYNREWYRKNKLRLAKKIAAYTEANRELINRKRREKRAREGPAARTEAVKAYHREWYRRNKDRVYAQIKARRAANRDEINAKRRAWRAKKRAALAINQGGSISRQDSHF